ncbi:MAG: protease inhibitor I42 family protein [Candidatus Omnitrophota bacterium]
MLKKQAIVVGITAIFITMATVFSFAKEAQNSREDKIVKAVAGKEFVIDLKSNITTGFQWQLAKAVDKEYLILTGLRYITKKSRITGSGGKEEWAFRAVKPGRTVISFQYVRPWEKKAAPADEKRFVIKIEKGSPAQEK